jgi:hypothetical protein
MRSTESWEWADFYFEDQLSTGHKQRMTWYGPIRQAALENSFSDLRGPRWTILVERGWTILVERADFVIASDGHRMLFLRRMP